jgi:hypothetical protein
MNFSGGRGYQLHPIAQLLLILAAAPASGDIQTTTQNMAASISPHGKISVPATIQIQALSTRFDSLGGGVTVSYWARTSEGGGGSLTLQAGSEFSPAGGPMVQDVTYSCTGGTLGTACSGSQTLAIAAQTPLLSLPAGACTGGGGSCSTQEPNTVQATFSVPNKPQYRTGTYSAPITFTISTL